MIPGQPVATGQKPLAEVVVEGELSPFEDETLYRILRKSFSLEHPSYKELLEEDVATRVNLVFHHPYSKEVFTNVLQENWRELKDLLKQVAHRRGRAGAGFTFRFTTPETQLVFKSGIVNERETASALDQIGHLTAIISQMLRPETMSEPIERVETLFDKKGDMWHGFRGSGSGKDFVFDESVFRWVMAVK